MRIVENAVIGIAVDSDTRTCLINGRRVLRFVRADRPWHRVICDSRGAALTADEAIAAAEQVLPGEEAPEGKFDRRWQAIIKVGEFVKTAPEVLWPFTLRWGSHRDADLRMAIATCVLEHLLEYHFDTLIARVETAAMGSPEFAQTVCACWAFGESDKSQRDARFRRLLARLRNAEPPT